MVTIIDALHNHEYWRYRGYRLEPGEIKIEFELSSLDLEAIKPKTNNGVVISTILPDSFGLLTQTGMTEDDQISFGDHFTPRLWDKRFSMLRFVPGITDYFMVYNPFCITSCYYRGTNADEDVGELPTTSFYFHLEVSVNGTDLLFSHTSFIIDLKGVTVALPFKQFDQGENTPYNMFAKLRAGAASTHFFSIEVEVNITDKQYQYLHTYEGEPTLTMRFDLENPEHEFIKQQFIRDIYPDTQTLVESTSLIGLHSLEFLEAYFDALNLLMTNIFPELGPEANLFKLEVKNKTQVHLYYRPNPHVDFMEMDKVSAQMPFPVKKLTIISIENMTKKMMSIEEIPIMDRSGEQLIELGNIAIQLGRLKNVAYITCHLCQTQTPQFQFGNSVVCQQCVDRHLKK